MRTKHLSLVLSLVLTPCVSSATQAQQAGRIESMKLLTADVGWAATNKRLFWTTDGGASWKDITPKLNHKEQHLSSVFFLDASTGWALLSCADNRDQLADDVCFEFASTTNAGDHWSIVHPKIADPVSRSAITEDGQGFSSSTFLNFADPQHGWAILKRNLPVGRSGGAMLRTVDGGKTWMQLPKGGLPAAENFCFFNANDGWLAGGPDQEFYRTRDGGNSWQRVSITTPAPISQDLVPVYDLPVFVNEKTGYLRATYESSASSGVTVVVFRTEDNGATWHSLITTGVLPDTHPWAAYPSAISGGELLTAAISGPRIDLTHFEQGTGSDIRSGHISVKASSVDQLSFVSPQRGWILAAYWILSTQDGGASWINATPEPAGTVPPQASLENGPTAMYLFASPSVQKVRLTASDLSLILRSFGRRIPSLAAIRTERPSDPSIILRICGFLCISDLGGSNARKAPEFHFLIRDDSVFVRLGSSRTSSVRRVVRIFRGKAKRHETRWRRHRLGSDTQPSFLDNGRWSKLEGHYAEAPSGQREY